MLVHSWKYYFFIIKLSVLFHYAFYPEETLNFIRLVLAHTGPVAYVLWDLLSRCMAFTDREPFLHFMEWVLRLIIILKFNSTTRHLFFGIKNMGVRAGGRPWCEGPEIQNGIVLSDLHCVGWVDLTSSQGFPGGAVVESLPANAGDTGSSPGLGGSHMPRSN